MRGFDGSTRRTNEVPKVERPPLPPEPVFDWLDRVREEPCPEPLVGEVRPVRLRYTQSATELMTARRKGGRGGARLRYLHGVLPVWRFAPAADRDGVPADVRGTLIHGVLEMIEDEARAGRTAAADAAKYRLQGLTYRTVLRTLTGGDAEVRFHFTRPNVAV